MNAMNRLIYLVLAISLVIYSLLVVKIKALLLGCNSSTNSDIDTTQEVGQQYHPVL